MHSVLLKKITTFTLLLQTLLSYVTQYYCYTKILLAAVGFFFPYTQPARELMMHTTLEHYPKEKNISVSSWQFSHEIHTPLAHIDPSE